MKTTKIENLTKTEITAIYNHLSYGIGLSNKLHQVLTSINYDQETLTNKLHKLDK